MASYTIVTDAGSMTVDAASADEAVQSWAKSEGLLAMVNVQQWSDHIASIDGAFGHIDEDGVEIARVGA